MTGRSALAALTLVALLGCREDASSPVVCLDYAAPAISASVYDASTGVAATGAIVRVTDGQYEDSALVSPYRDLVGLAYERAGVYAVSATKPGYALRTANGIQVSRDACHVVTVRLNLALMPSSHIE